MTQPVSSVNPVPPNAAHARREQVARDFEAVFAGQLAKLMLEQMEVSEEFGGGHGEAMFRGILAEELGKSMAAAGTLGIAPAVLAQIQQLEGGK